MFFKIAGVQFPVTGNVKDNMSAILHAIEYSADAGADILLTPEGSLSGYTHEFLQDEVDAALLKIVDAARSVGIGLALGTCFYEQSCRCYNQIRMYDKRGNLLGTHSKILLCGDPDDLRIGEHLRYSTKPLEVFHFCGVNVGCLICNDLWANPEWTPGDDAHLTRQLASMGAQVILHAANCCSDGGEYSQAVQAYHEANLRIRAHADRLWIVTVNSNATDHPCLSTSGVVTPDGSWAITVPNCDEQHFIYAIELQ